MEQLDKKLRQPAVEKIICVFGGATGIATTVMDLLLICPIAHIIGRCAGSHTCDCSHTAEITAIIMDFSIASCGMVDAYARLVCETSSDEAVGMISRFADGAVEVLEKQIVPPLNEPQNLKMMNDTI